MATGFHKCLGIDYYETSNLVIKPTTVYLILNHALSFGWSLCQLDVNNAYLHGHLSEDVYIVQPSGFVDKQFPTYVYCLQKALYSLK